MSVGISTIDEISSSLDNKIKMLDRSNNNEYFDVDDCSDVLYHDCLSSSTTSMIDYGMMIGGSDDKIDPHHLYNSAMTTTDSTGSSTPSIIESSDTLSIRQISSSNLFLSLSTSSTLCETEYDAPLNNPITKLNKGYCITEEKNATYDLSDIYYNDERIFLNLLKFATIRRKAGRHVLSEDMTKLVFSSSDNHCDSFDSDYKQREVRQLFDY